MSGFFGIFRPQGGPVDPEEFEQMQKATEREGFDGMETHVEEKIAMGHLMLRVSPESKYDKQPLKSSCGKYLLVGHFRLDYRDELGDKLGLTQSELELTPDSQLVMLSYQKWKEKCVHHIEGDWAFVIYSFDSHSIFIAKDRIGNSAIFYTKRNGIFLFSSDIITLSYSRVEFSELDLKQLARLSFNGIDIENGKTLLANTFHVKNGYSISMHQDAILNQICYWELSQGVKNFFKFTKDYEEIFQSLFSASVRSRISSSKNVGLFLSSGLDSTAIAYFAAKELRYKCKKLYTFTSFPQYLSEIPSNKINIAREDLDVKKYVSHFENVESEYLNFAGASISGIVESQRTLDFFNPIVSNNIFWVEGILNQAKNKEVNLVLNGQLGNYTISWNAPYLNLSRFQQFKFRELHKSISEISKIRRLSYFLVFFSEILRPFKNNILKYFRFINPFQNVSFKKESILSDFILNRFDWAKEKKSFGYIPGYSYFKTTKNLRIELLKKNSYNSGIKWYLECLKNNLISSDPSSDIRLVEFLFSIPEDLYYSKNISKFLLKQVLAKKVPDFILKKNMSSIQAFDLSLRISVDTNFNRIKNQMVTDFPNEKFFKIRLMVNQFNEIIVNKTIGKRLELCNIFLKNLSIFRFLKNYI
jgi:asparagine synthase (glutamine-hydrolysing)